CGKQASLLLERRALLQQRAQRPFRPVDIVDAPAVLALHQIKRDGGVRAEVPEFHGADGLGGGAVLHVDRECVDLEILRVDEGIGAERWYFAASGGVLFVGFDQAREAGGEIFRASAARELDAFRVPALVGRVDAAEKILRRLFGGKTARAAQRRGDHRNSTAENN